jgi:hypothetical protein
MADDTDARIDVAVACRVLGVSRSGYYDWLGRPPSLRAQENTLLLKLIEKIHADSRKIILADADLSSPLTRLRYVKHWDSKRAELDREMRDLGQENLHGIREDLDLYETIRNTVASIMHLLRDMNTLTPEIHHRSGFEQLYDALASILDSK